MSAIRSESVELAEMKSLFATALADRQPTVINKRVYSFVYETGVQRFELYPRKVVLKTFVAGVCTTVREAPL